MGWHMKEENIKRVRLLRIWEILKQETDEDHPMGTPTLLEKLNKTGIVCDRRTLYADIKVLNDFGYEILCNRSASNQYYVVDRTFDVPEVQILLDAVQASSFISEKKTEQLVDKVASLAGSKRADVLKQNIVWYGTPKGNNEGLFYSVSEISLAINSKHKIGFYYFDYDERHNRVYRVHHEEPHERRWYEVNPVATVFHDDKYYLFCYNDRHLKMVQYRVDKMEQVKMLDAPITKSKESAGLDLAKHKRSLVGMFGGETQEVTFEANKSVIDSIFDKFGDGVKFVSLPDDKVKFSVKVQLSNPFYSWVIGFGNKLKVTAPQDAVEDIQRLLQEAVEMYK